MGDSDGNDDCNPTEPAEKSQAPPGEVCEPPTDGGTIIEVENTDDEPFGLLIKWDEGVWLFARDDAYSSLDSRL